MNSGVALFPSAMKDESNMADRTQEPMRAGLFSENVGGMSSEVNVLEMLPFQH